MTATSAVAWARLLAPGLAVYAALVWRFDFVCDDAYIAFRYARHFADGLGLRYNPGVEPPVEGYSNLLWVLWLSLAEWLGWEVTLFARVSAAVCGALLLCGVVAVVARRLELPWPIASATGVFLGSFPPFAVWTTGGLETVPFALLLFASHAALAEARSPRGALLAGGTLVATALMRTDGFLWAGGLWALSLAHAWLGGGRAALRPIGTSLRPVALAGVLLLLGVCAHEAWRIEYYGDFVSNTVRAKSALSVETLERGARYVAHAAASILSLPLVLVGALALVGRRGHPWVLRSLVVVGATLVYAALVGGDFMAMGRLLVPGVPFLALLFAACLGRLQDLAGGRPALAWAAASLCIGLSLLPAFNLHATPRALRAALHFRWNIRHYGSEYQEWRAMKLNAESWAVLGRALKQLSRPGDSLVADAIGAVGYYSDLFIYDRAGLVNREVARLPSAGLRSPGHDRMVPTSFFLERDPTFLVARLATMKGEARRVPDFRVPLDRSLQYSVIPDDLPRDGSLVFEKISLDEADGHPPDQAVLLVRPARGG